MRWMDPEVGARYGNIVFARCGGAATTSRAPARTGR
jgi:hypothetical protein